MKEDIVSESHFDIELTNFIFEIKVEYWFITPPP